jgi:MFS family permease
MRNRIALLAALGIDNFGSGLFLPLAIVYVTRVVRLSLGAAGTLVALGTLAGLAVPALVGRVVDHAGPKPVIIGAQFVQAAGAVVYLLARAAPAVLVAAMLLAAGQQTFYSSLTALIADVAGDVPRDRIFAISNMVRAACFGVGALVAAGLLTRAGPSGLRITVGADGVSFVLCSVVLAVMVRLPRPQAHANPESVKNRPRVLADRPFLGLIAATGLAVLALDFFLTGMPVYALEILHSRPWLPGATLALETLLGSAAGTAVLYATHHLSRLRAMQLGAGLYALWCAISAAAVRLPGGWRAADLLAATVLLAAGGLVFMPRAAALAEAVAPPQARGRFLAAYQYAFTTAGVLAPAVVALFSVATWLPWALVAACSVLAIIVFGRIAGRLPKSALSSGPSDEAGTQPAPLPYL